MKGKVFSKFNGGADAFCQSLVTPSKIKACFGDFTFLNVFSDQFRFSSILAVTSHTTLYESVIHLLVATPNNYIKYLD